MLAGIFCLTPPLLLHLNQLTDLRFMKLELGGDKSAEVFTNAEVSHLC